MTADRPLTERERAAVIEDLSRYRVLLADARRELLDFAWCACLACRRERAALALLGPRPNPSAPLGALSGQSKGHSAGAAAQVKKIYVALAEDVAAEIPTRLAGIRALEADLDLGARP